MAFSPEIFGRYVLLSRIAVGGMAEIFRARVLGEEGLSRVVAVKRLLPQFNSDPSFVSMFITEARLSSQLGHANIVPIYDFGRIDGQFFIAMEYVQGVDAHALSLRTRSKGMPLADSVVAHIVAEAANGLDYAHRRVDDSGRALNLVHRDVSPQNILLSFEGEVKVADFGIAVADHSTRMTQAGVLKGKLQYMAPEQALGLALDRRVDTYGLGAVLYELLCGKAIRDGNDELRLLDEVRTGQIAPITAHRPTVPEELLPILAKALAKHPDDRYQTAAEMRDVLLEFVASHQQVPAARSLAATLSMAFEAEQSSERTDLQREQAEALTLVAQARTAGIPLDSDPALGAELTSPAAIVDGTIVRTVPSDPAVTDPAVSVLDLDAPAPKGKTIVKPRSGLIAEAPAAAEAEGSRWTLLLLLPVGMAIGVVGFLAVRAINAAPPPEPPAFRPTSMAEVASRPPPPLPEPEKAKPAEPEGKPPELVKPEKGAEKGPDKGSKGKGKKEHKVAVVKPPPAGFGTLEIQAKPWANVFIDGNMAGQTPLTLKLPAGDHRVQLTYPGKPAQTDTVHIVNGRTSKKLATMD